MQDILINDYTYARQCLELSSHTKDQDYLQNHLLIIAVGAVWQRDSMGMVNENNELKLRLQAMEQQAQLREGKWMMWWTLYIAKYNPCLQMKNKILFQVVLDCGSMPFFLSMQLWMKH